MPHPSILSRRASSLDAVLPRQGAGKSLHILVDATGLKVYGEGEWKVRVHSYQKRRTWRKLHLAVDEATAEIVAVVTTTSNVSDKEVLLAFDDGLLVFDDSTLDKPFARQIELVSRHWSDKHHAVVRGINLMTLLWTDGDRHIPCDYRLYDKAKDGLTKNDHFQQVLEKAHTRGFQPRCIAFDSCYASLPNLKKIRSFQWIWLTRLKENRLVNPDRQGGGHQPTCNR